MPRSQIIGLMLGHDPYSKPIATVGGAISTNGVGYLAARYGSMGAQVAALEVVLPTGDVMTTKAVPKPASGPDLNALFIGSEGTLGIITAAALRVFPLYLSAVASPQFRSIPSKMGFTPWQRCSPLACAPL